MARITKERAMEYVGLKKDGFQTWCEKVGLKCYRYENSNRVYFHSGFFYFLADREILIDLKSKHGKKWCDFYLNYSEVLPYMKEQPIMNDKYVYISKDADIDKLRNDLMK